MNFQPFGTRIVIELVEAKTETEGGILLPDSAVKKPTEGTVVAVGPGKVLQSGDVYPCQSQVGDKVLFSKYTGSEVEIEGKAYTILEEEMVLGRIASSV